MYIDGRIQLKSARYEISPPTKKMRSEVHVSASVARARARCSNQRSVNVASTTEIVPSASAIRSGNHTSPPNAAWRSAMMPQ